MIVRYLAVAFVASGFVSTSAIAQLPVTTKPGARAALPGTLFFSPADRERLDRQRENAGKPDEEARPEKPVINGFVRRSDGVVAVWIDSRRIDPVPGGYGDRLSGASVGGEVPNLKISPSDTLTVKQAAPSFRSKAGPRKRTGGR